MNSEQKPKSLHVQHGHGCSIAWHEPVRADGCDNRRIKATCLRRFPVNGVVYWDIVVDLDGEKFGDMVLLRDSRTYAVEIARAMVSAIKYKACHARRNRLNRKARRDADATSRRKLEQMYFEFAYGKGGKVGRPKAESGALPKLKKSEEAAAIWAGVMRVLDKSAVMDAVPLLDEKATRVCKERLGDLYEALKRHLEEF